jgi:hypothetical protein
MIPSHSKEDRNAYRLHTVGIQRAELTKGIGGKVVMIMIVGMPQPGRMPKQQ